MNSAMANGRSSLRSVKRGSGARANDSSTPGVSVAGGSASTLARSSGEAGTPASQPPPVAPPLRAAPRWAAPPPRPPPAPAGDVATADPGGRRGGELLVCRVGRCRAIGLRSLRPRRATGWA